MKKFVFGMMLTIIGVLFFGFSFCYAIMNPAIYNNISGLLGALLCADLVEPFFISFIVMIVGLGICAYEAYRKPNK